METEALPPAAEPTAALTSETLPHSKLHCQHQHRQYRPHLWQNRTHLSSIKGSSLTHRLQAPDKEAAAVAVDVSESLHRKLSVLAAKTGRKKVEIVRMLLEDGLKEVDG